MKTILLSAYIEDVAVSDLPKDVRATVEQMVTVKKGAKVPQYGMTVKELVPKADPHNLRSARRNVKTTGRKKCGEEVRRRAGEKYILLLNDRIIDGHHFLAKAERGQVTNSLMVLDLTTARFQMSSRIQATINLAEGGRRRSRVVDGAVIVGGTGVGYAGYRIGRAAAAAEKVARDAGELTGAAVKAKRMPGRVVGRLRRVLRFSTVEFADKRDRRELPPAVKAGLSGAASGAVLGALPLLRRGVTVRKGLKSILATGGASAAIVGGGTIVGSKILGKPRRDEGAAYTKRAALGGALAGAGGGLTAGILATKTRGGRKVLAKLAKTWRPAALAKKTGVAGASAIGGTAGLAVGGFQGADEGQQVDSLDNLKKDLKKKKFSGRLGAVIELAGRDPIGYEGGVPLTGKVNRDRWVKKLRDEDLTRRDANLARAGVAGAVVGALTRGRVPTRKRALLGGLAGVGGVLAIRQATNLTKDPYGERSREGKAVESVPAVAGVGAAGALALRRLRKVRKFEGGGGSILLARMERTIIELGKADQPRYADSKRYADPLRAYGDAMKLVDGDGNPTRLTQSQLVGAAWRTGQHVRRVGQRGGNLVRDVSDVAHGRGSRGGRKREWEKSWFRNAVLTGGGAGAVLANSVLRRKVPLYRLKTDAVAGVARSQIAKARGRLDKALDLDAQIGGTILFRRLERTIDFAYDDRKGWDLRDARGKSARVFAPGSRKRNRRTAEWHETKDGQRKILTGVAIAGTVGGALAGTVLGRRLPKRRSRLSVVERPIIEIERVSGIHGASIRRKPGGNIVPIKP